MEPLGGEDALVVMVGTKFLVSIPMRAGRRVPSSGTVYVEAVPDYPVAEAQVVLALSPAAGEAAGLGEGAAGEVMVIKKTCNLVGGPLPKGASW